MSASIERVGVGQLERLVPLFDAYRQFYGQIADLDRARRWLSQRIGSDQAVVFLATIDGLGAGFTLLYPGWSSVSTGQVMVLNDLYVAPSARRKGIALALLAAAVDYARSVGALRLSLETARDNHAAQALYRRAGWTADETQWFHLRTSD